MAKMGKTALILIILLSPAFLWAATTDYATNSWDDAGGLTATVNNSKDTVEVSGTRVSQTAWNLERVAFQMKTSCSQKTCPNPAAGPF